MIQAPARRCREFLHDIRRRTPSQVTPHWSKRAGYDIIFSTRNPQCIIGDIVWRNTSASCILSTDSSPSIYFISLPKHSS